MGTKERSEKEEVVMSRCAGVKKEQPGNGLRRGMEEPDRREEEEEAGEMERERSGRERERKRERWRERERERKRERWREKREGRAGRGSRDDLVVSENGRPGQTVNWRIFPGLQRVQGGSRRDAGAEQECRSSAGVTAQGSYEECNVADGPG